MLTTACYLLIKVTLSLLNSCISFVLSVCEYGSGDSRKDGNQNSEKLIQAIPVFTRKPLGKKHS